MNYKQIYRLVNKEWIPTRPVTEDYRVAILLHAEGNVPSCSVLIQRPKQKLRYMQSSCHAQGHDIRDTLYQTITPLNKMTSIPIPLLEQCFFPAFYLTMLPTSKGGQHSSVGTTTYYRPVSPRFEPSGEHNFSDPTETAPRPTQPPIQWVLGLFPGSKEAPPNPF
jgi:hypothetical protein